MCCLDKIELFFVNSDYCNTRKMDLLNRIIADFACPLTIDNIDVLCYQRDVYEGIYQALESAERLGHNTDKQCLSIKLKIDKLNDRIKQLAKDNFHAKALL